MIKISETRARRDTLNQSNIIPMMKVKLMSESNESRLVSITNSELKSLKWLEYLEKSSMSYFEIPREIKPNQVPQINLKCEDDYKEIEEGTADSKTPQDYVEFLNNPQSETNYNSVPIYNNSAFEKINQLSSRFTKTPNPIRYLHIKSANFDITGLMNTVVMNFFIYNNGPITEAVQMDFTSVDIHFSHFKYFYQKHEIIFPYPESPDTYFVCVIYFPQPDKETGGIFFNPICIGHCKIMDNQSQQRNRNYKLQGVLSPEFTRYDPSIPFHEHFTRPKHFQITIQFDYTIQISVENLAATQPIISRLTSFRNMIPTPLLTFYDFSINLTSKLQSKKIIKREAYIKVTLKMLNENGKLAETKLFAGTTQKELTESGYTSRLLFKAEKINFPEHLNFYLSPEIDQPITAQIDVFLTQDSSSKNVGSITFQIDKSSKSFIDQKLDSKNNLISFKYSYPDVFAPPRLLRDVLVQPWNANPENFKDPFYNEIAPYAINTYLQPEKWSLFDFQKFYNLFPSPDESEIQEWIEHYFNCDKEFLNTYFAKLTESIHIIIGSPFPFFLLLFKILAIEKKFHEAELTKLLDQCVELSNIVNPDGAKLRETIADFIIRLKSIYQPKSVFNLAFHYIFQLTNYSRLHVYSILFSDISLIQSITFNFRIDLEKNQSPYIKIISLFYRTLHQTFIENQRESVNLAVLSLTYLSTSLEGFCNQSTSLEVVHFLFPLLPMIFTFYDSLSVQLSEGNPDSEIQESSILMPIILYILKYCNITQFINYFNVLSYDSQLRFLGFLCIIIDDQIVQSITKRAPPNSVNEITITNEITYRILTFLSFFEKLENLDEKLLHSIFNLILRMLKSTKQASDSYDLLFKTLTFFISKYPDKIFTEKTTLLSQLLETSVELTQRKCYKARAVSIGFIIWLIEAESKHNQNSPRCAMLLQSVICMVYLEKKQFIPFFEHLPKLLAFDQVKKFYEILKDALESTILDLKVSHLLELANNHYKNFPAIRARFLSQIVELNRINGDIASAFITQWRLCGFIAEVFKLKGQIVEGIPKEGIKAFPFIFDEPPIDLSIYPEHSAYIAIDSEMFNETYICQAMQEAIILCKQAGFDKLISKVTEFLFNTLEKRREFIILKQLYESVSQSYLTLNSSEDSHVEFSRVFLSKPLSDRFGFTEAIRISQIKKEYADDQEIQTMQMQMLSKPDLIDGGPEEVDDIKKYEELLIKEGGIKSDSNLPLDSTTPGQKENIFQILKVHYSQIEFNEMRTLVFTKNIYESNENEIRWNQTLVKRIIYTTESSLPHPVTYSKIINTKIQEITRHDYYLEKLNHFISSFMNETDNLSSVLPPEGMKAIWAQYTLALNSSPLLKKIAKIVLASQSDDRNTLIYEIVLRINVPEETKKRKRRDTIKDKDKDKDKELENEKGKEKKEKEKNKIKRKINISDVPQDIVNLSKEIWSMLRRAILLIDKVFELTRPSDADRKMLAKCREVLDVPITVQKVYMA